MSKYIPREEWLELYKHPLWQKKRLEIMEYAEFQCQGCGTKDLTLHVHHARYKPGKKPWQYPNGWLTCMCEVCHGRLHPEKKVVTPAESARPWQPITVPPLLEPIWAGVIAKVRLERKLISAWVESGYLTEMDEHGAVVVFPESQRMARDFLEGHLDVLINAFSAVCGRQICPSLRIVGEKPLVTAKFGPIFDMLGKL